MNSLDKSRRASLRHVKFGAILVIAVLHLVGLFGLNSIGYHTHFEKVASLNLLFSFILIMTFHRPIDGRFFAFCAFAFITGMAAEIAGVNTGWVFGSYYYTSSFGWQIVGVPVIIGVNWILLSYATAVVAYSYFQIVLIRIVSAASFMVLIDLLLERFAIRHHFWVWTSSSPPLYNYISWFIVSIIIQIVAVNLIPDKRNVLARHYLVILLLFLSADLLISIFSRTF